VESLKLCTGPACDNP